MSRLGAPTNTGSAPLVAQKSDRSHDGRAKDGGSIEGPRAVGAASGWESRALVEEELEVDPGELSEFLAADFLEVGADPVFKERLRAKLWRVVSERFGPTESQAGGMSDLAPGRNRKSGTFSDEDL